MLSNFAMTLKKGAVHVTGHVHIQDFQEIASLASEIAGTDDLEMDTELALQLGAIFIAAPPSVLVKLRTEHLTTLKGKTYEN